MKVIEMIINCATRLSSYIAGIVLFGMMMLTTIDVICRYFFNASILGVYEITEFMMVCLVFFSLSFAQKLKGHVAVNILVDRLSNKPRHIFDVFNFLISIIFLLLIAWMSFSQGIELLHSNRVSGNLTIPVYPFFFVVALGCVAMALELLRDLITGIRGIVK
ncbi:TRAP transporter small permease [Thermodesulfobacteriota bacterium]